MADPTPLSPSDPERLGRWRLLGRIGSGGQGVVYLGRPVKAGRRRPERVAVKLLRAQLLGDPEARERFVRELALLRRVAGFCTAQVLEADVDGDLPYIVSEYIPGPSLRTLVREEGPRTGADLDRLAVSSVTALSAIHRAGIVHRDFKPQNVLMSPDGPRVIDFGVARLFDAVTTPNGQTIGTPAYMAPEQFSGRSEPASDLFAWAGTLLFAATGRDPFDGGPAAAVMYRVIHEEPDLGALPKRLAEVAAACLAKDPDRRPSADEVLFRLLGERGDTAPVKEIAESLSASTRKPDPAMQSTDDPAARSSGSQGRSSGPAADGSDAETAGALVPVTSDEPHDSEEPRDGTTDGSADGPADGSADGPANGSGDGPADGSTDRFGWDAGPPTVPTGTRWSAAFGEVRRGRLYRPLPRGPALVAGLGLAVLLAAQDVAAVADLVRRPEFGAGPRGQPLLVVASSFAALAAITLLGALLAWRGSRAAAGTVMGARVARVVMWGAWGAVAGVEPSAFAAHVALTVAALVLLGRALMRRPVPPAP